MFLHPGTLAVPIVLVSIELIHYCIVLASLLDFAAAHGVFLRCCPLVVALPLLTFGFHVVFLVRAQAAGFFDGMCILPHCFTVFGQSAFALPDWPG